MTGIPATWYSALGAALILLVVSCVDRNPQVAEPVVFGEPELRAAFADLPTSFKEEDMWQDMKPSVAEEIRRGHYSDFLAFVREDPYQRIVAQSGWISDSERVEYDKSLFGHGLLNSLEWAFALTKGEGEELLESGLLPPPGMGDFSVGVYLESVLEDVPQQVEIIVFRHGNLVTRVSSHTLHQRSPDVPAEVAARMLDLKIHQVEVANEYAIANSGLAIETATPIPTPEPTSTPVPTATPTPTPVPTATPFPTAGLAQESVEGIRKLCRDGTLPGDSTSKPTFVRLCQSFDDGKMEDLAWLRQYWRSVTVRYFASLVEAGVDVNAKDNIIGMTPLHWAAALSTQEMVRFLLDNGADLETVEEATGKTPLFSAALNPNLDVAKLLLASGSDIKARDGRSFTPLHSFARRNSNPMAIALLLDQGAEVNSATKAGLTPLHQAAGHNPNPEVIALLIDRGADVNARSSTGYTPLHWAIAFSRWPEVAELLLERGAASHVRSISGFTPCDFASVQDQLPTAVFDPAVYRVVCLPNP